MLSNKKFERGQVMILLVFGVVVLMGFAALAVDGSMVYADRRYDQSAADSAALAGAGAAARILENNHIVYEKFSCTNGTVISAKNAAINAGKTRAESNLIPLDTDLSDNKGIEVICGIKDMGAYKDKYLDVHVQITTETQTAFAQLIFKGKLKNTVDAVVTVRPRATATFGYAIVSLSSTCGNGSNDGGVSFDGSNDIDIANGGVYSASCIRKDGSAQVDVTPASAGVVDSTGYLLNGGSGAVNPTPTQTDADLPPIFYPTPDCTGLDNYGDHNGGGTLEPGIYDQIRITNKDVLHFNPGLYCVSGGLIANGGEISGNDVTFYMTGGDFNIGAAVKVNLQAPLNDPAPDHSVTGMLIRMPDNGSSSQQVDMNGTSDSSFLGLVYVPKALIDVGGSSSNLSTISCQLVGNTVKLHGDVRLDINFKTENSSSKSSSLDLNR